MERISMEMGGGSQDTPRHRTATRGGKPPILLPACPHSETEIIRPRTISAAAGFHPGENFSLPRENTQKRCLFAAERRGLCGAYKDGKVPRIAN